MSGSRNYSGGDLERWDSRQWWGDRLVPVSAAVVRERAITTATSAFLTDVGLPVECPLGVTFYRDSRLLAAMRFRDADYLVIGDDYGTSLALEPSRDAVWSIDKGIHRFVNSNVAHFVGFLGMYRFLADRCEDLSGKQESGVVDAFHAWMLRQDDAAFADEDHWWSLIIEQMENGLL